MSNIDATKFYIRHREGYPETEMQEYARRGFWTLGIETAPFTWIDDIDSLEDLGSTVGVAGYIGDVHRGLTKLGKSIPPNIDYPPSLHEFLGRKIWAGTLNEVRGSVSKLFVKPREHKLFTGFVWHPLDRDSRMRVVIQHDDCPVWIAEPVEFVSEYRSFILNQDIIDVRKYKGDWSKAPDRDIVERAVKAMESPPHAYCLDWGVTSDGRTLLVEMNEGFAFGHYGLHPVSYARMLSARWMEMTI